MLFGAPGKRLYAVTPDLADTGALLEKCSAALTAGIGALQYRNKKAPAALRRTQARELQMLCLRHNTALIINDDWPLATELGATGSHIGSGDGSLPEVRRDFAGVLGVSCYNALEAAVQAEQQGADYVAFGRFFASTVKPEAVAAKPDLLERAKAALTVPVVAIGGITLENAARLRAAGADAVAVITGLFEAADVGARVHAFNRLLD